MITTEQFELIQRIAVVYQKTMYKSFSVDVIITMMLRAHGLGLPVTEAPELFQQLHGKLTLSANAMATLIKRAGYSWIVNHLDDDRAELTIFSSAGHGLGKSIFTIDDAKQAGIIGKNKNWDNYPRNMLMARALSNAAKWYAPDAFGGAPVYTPDELGGDDAGYTSAEVVVLDDTPTADNVTAITDDPPESKARDEDGPIKQAMAVNIARKFTELCDGSNKDGKHYRQYALSCLRDEKTESAKELTVTEGRLALHILSAEKMGRDKVGTYAGWSLIREEVFCEALGVTRDGFELWLQLGVLTGDKFQDAKEVTTYMRGWKFDDKWKKLLAEQQAMEASREQSA